MQLKAEDQAKVRLLMQLNKTQQEVLWRTCAEQKQPYIGRQMGVSESTVTGYMKQIYQILQIPRNAMGAKKMQKVVKDGFCHLIPLMKEIWAGQLDANDYLVVPSVLPEDEPSAASPEGVRPEAVLVVLPLPREDAGQHANGSQDRTWKQSRRETVQPLQTPPVREGRFWRAGCLLVTGLLLLAAAWSVVQFLPAPFAPIQMLATRTPPGDSIPFTGDGNAERAGPIVFPPRSTPSPAATSLETPQPPGESQILYANNFATDPTDMLISGKIALVNGQLVAQEDVLLIIGQDTWKDYAVSFQTPKPFCNPFGNTNVTVGLRAKNRNHMVALQLCENQESIFATIDPDWKEIPFSQTEWRSDCCEVSVQEDEFHYNDTRITVPGFPEGKVYIWISEGTGISNLEIRSLP